MSQDWKGERDGIQDIGILSALFSYEDEPDIQTSSREGRAVLRQLVVDRLLADRENQSKFVAEVGLSDAAHLESTLARMTEMYESLCEQVSDLRAQIAKTGEGATEGVGSAWPEGHVGAEWADQQPAQGQGDEGSSRSASPQALEGRTAASVVSDADESGDAKWAARVVSLANDAAEQVRAEAVAEAARIVADARSRAEEYERISQEKVKAAVANAEQAHAEAVDSLNRERLVLEKKVDGLRSFEREFRSRLSTYLESQIRDLESRSSAAPTDGLRRASESYSSTAGSHRRVESA